MRRILPRPRRLGSRRMRTLHPAYRVADLDASLDFYLAVGFEEVGRVQLGDGGLLVMLKLPDDPFVALELVHDPAIRTIEQGNAFSHLPVQVDDLESFVARLSAEGLECGPIERPGPLISWLTDPDGYRIELVEWPAGHPAGITAADFEAS